LFEYEDGIAVQIFTNNGTRHIYRVSPQVAVHINDVLGRTSDLRQGMMLTLILTNTEITEIKAESSHRAIAAAQNGIADSGITGIVDEIRLTRFGVFITIANESGIKEYKLAESVDHGLLHIGARVNFTLDSGGEAAAVVILQDRS
jgi:hypothetical protein